MSLYTKVIDLQKLHQAWDRVRKNRPASGVDSVSCEQFNEGREDYLKELHAELKEHRYNALPVRLHTLYKGEKAREIALYSMRDKVVQQSLAYELNRIFEPQFSDRAYAYRQDKSALHAIEEVGKAVKSGEYACFVKVDISKFFDTIQWDMERNTLGKYIFEEDVIELIWENACTASLDTTSGELVDKRLGIWQGSAVSPILSNIYLMGFDKWLDDTPGVFHIRYSDDMVILVADVNTGLNLLQEITVRLENLGLRINDSKSTIGSVEDGFDFLGYRFDADGGAIPARAKQDLAERLEMMWLTSGEIGFDDKIKKASEIIGGWEQYFRGERNLDSMIEYVVAVYMSDGSEDQKSFLEARRPGFHNVYRDIMMYLASVWRETGKRELELLEYEQFYQVADEEISLSDSDRYDELTDVYRAYVILETEDTALDLMQIYSDMCCYRKAEHWQEVWKKLHSEPGGNAAAEDVIRVEGGVTPIYDKNTAGRMMATLVGREDIYSLENPAMEHSRRVELQTKPLTEDVLRAHLKGAQTVGTYLMRPNGTAHCMVFDVDISKKLLLQHERSSEEYKRYMEKAFGRMMEIKKFLRAMGAEGYPEYSGCRGYHIWVFFMEWIPERFIHMLAEMVLAQLPSEESDITVEYFPGKVKMRPGKPGIPIKIPYGIHSATGERSYFLDDAGAAVTEINYFLDGLSRLSTESIKKILASRTGVKESRNSVNTDIDLSVFGDISDGVKEVLGKCGLMRYLCQKAVKTSYLTHFERLSLLYVFGHLGEDGQQFLHKIMAFTLNYQYQITEKFIRKIPEKPISCPKLRDQYKTVTAEIGCNCNFRHNKNCYPSPVLHAVSRSNDEKTDVTLPTTRSLTKENEKKVADEINIHKKAQQLAEKILEMKKQKRSLDRSIQKLEGDLDKIFDEEKIESLEIELGLLVRKRTEEGREWVIEI